MLSSSLGQEGTWGGQVSRRRNERRGRASRLPCRGSSFVSVDKPCRFPPPPAAARSRAPRVYAVGTPGPQLGRNYHLKHFSFSFICSFAFGERIKKGGCIWLWSPICKGSSKCLFYLGMGLGGHHRSMFEKTLTQMS